MQRERGSEAGDGVGETGTQCDKQGGRTRGQLLCACGICLACLVSTSARPVLNCSYSRINLYTYTCALSNFLPRAYAPARQEPVVTVPVEHGGEEGRLAEAAVKAAAAKLLVYLSASKGVEAADVSRRGGGGRRGAGGEYGAGRQGRMQLGGRGLEGRGLGAGGLPAGAGSMLLTGASGERVQPDEQYGAGPVSWTWLAANTGWGLAVGSGVACTGYG